jgi:hypothetical protein
LKRGRQARNLAPPFPLLREAVFMQFKITNTTNDRMKADLHRTATKFLTEPMVNGSRLYPGQSLIVSEDYVRRNQEMLRGWHQKGIIDIDPVYPVPLNDDEIRKAEEDKLLAEMIAAEEAAKEQKLAESYNPPNDPPPELRAEAPVAEAAPVVGAKPAVEEPKKGPGRPRKS